MRRATLDRAVMAKHFAPVGAKNPRSPLLATWIMSDGRLQTTGEHLALDVAELSEDLHDWPTGHFVIRQRESDDLLTELRRYEGRELSTDERPSPFPGCRFPRAQLATVTIAPARLPTSLTPMMGGHIPSTCGRRLNATRCQPLAPSPSTPSPVSTSSTCSPRSGPASPRRLAASGSASGRSCSGPCPRLRRAQSRRGADRQSPPADAKVKERLRALPCTEVPPRPGGHRPILSIVRRTVLSPSRS